MEIISTRLTQRPVTNYPRCSFPPLLQLRPCYAAIAGRCNNCCSRLIELLSLTHTFSRPLSLSLTHTLTHTLYVPVHSSRTTRSMAWTRRRDRRERRVLYPTRFTRFARCLNSGFVSVASVRQLQFVPHCSKNKNIKRAAGTSMGRWFTKKN